MNKSEQRALELYPIKERHNKNGTGTYDPNYPRRHAYLKGYDDALVNHKQLWKDAQGDDIPEIDREVIALVGLEDNDYKVVFAHRVNTAGYNGKSLITGETIRYVPKGYDKGCWNQPNLRFWLDLPLPVKEGGEYDSKRR